MHFTNLTNERIKIFNFPFLNLIWQAQKNILQGFILQTPSFTSFCKNLFLQIRPDNGTRKISQMDLI